MECIAKWIKIGKVHDFVFIGKEIIATTSGNYVIFFNLITKEKRIEYFNSITRGNGASCLAGHSIIPVFCTAERCSNPKIYIHTYPEIRKVSVCKLKSEENSYISCCFAGTEYLISLASFPTFQLSVWLWRTGEKITFFDTMLTDEFQTIDACLNPAHLIYQFSPKLGQVKVYEVKACSRKVIFLKNKIKSIEHKIAAVSWTNAGNLLLCDVLKNIHVVSSDGKKLQLVHNVNANTDEIDYEIAILSYHNGFLIIEDNSRLTCYNKTFLENNVNKGEDILWSIKCPFHPIKICLARHKDVILLNSRDGRIFELCLTQDNKPEFEEISNDCQKFKYMCSLKPEESHCVLVDSYNSLMILNIFNGEILANYEVNAEDEILCMETHPYISLVAVGTSTGKFISFIASIEEIKILKTIHLQRQLLNLIKFCKNGAFLGIASTTSNDIFLMNVIVNEEIDVFFHKKFNNSILDFLIYENSETIELLILFKTFSKRCFGNFIEIYSINKSEDLSFKVHKVYMSNYFERLIYGTENICDFLGSPYLSKQIHLFKIENNYESIALVNAVSSFHNLRKFDINISKRFMLTSGFDGQIILRDNFNLSKIMKQFTIFHYQEKGTKNSLLSACGKIIISLGANGSLICLKFNNSEEDIDVKKVNCDIEKLTWDCMNTERILINENKTWLEKQEKKTIEIEMNKKLALKNTILQDIEELRLKLCELLNSNETKSKESQLAISAFDLNAEMREVKINAAMCKQKEKKVHFENLICKNERIIDYLMKNFWDSYEVHDCTLVSFNSNIHINNYPLYHSDKLKKVDDFSVDLFKIPVSNALFQTNDNKDHVYDEDLKEPFNQVNECTAMKSRTEFALSGLTSFYWIEDDVPLNQESKMIFDYKDNDIITSRENKLKIYFNKQFNEMKSLKSNVVQSTSEHLKTLNQFKSELKNLFNIDLEIDKFTNVKFYSIENQENTITVTEEEVSSVFQTNILLNNHDDSEKPVIESKGSLKIDSLSITENECNFRHKKLEEMMDGVLEKRWEDEIKKDVPKPECLLFKHPSKYTEQDIETINDYKQKVQNLEIERQKYKIHLETQIQNINDQVKADIENFDKKMEKFFLEKIKIQSAILQEFLLRLNEKRRQVQLENEKKKIFDIVNNDLAILENENKILLNDIMNAESIVLDLKSKYENLSKRDKALEGKFRNEFGDLQHPLMEHLFRQYKRRPRISQISCTSLTFLIETNRCLMAGKKSVILSREYLDFLRGMDSLDVMPNSLPPQIDSNIWHSLCRLRRNKVEMEIKLRIAALEIAEAEQTLFYLQKLNSLMQSKMYFFKNSVEEETLKQTEILKNPEIQLVLKESQIETTYTGYISDFENATIETYEQLIKVNDIIRKEGEKKIEAMRALIILRKSILFNEWKYQRIFKKLKHLKKHLIFIQNTKVNKNMQHFLVERLNGKTQRKPISCSKMLRSVQKKFERMLKEEKTGLLKLIAGIKYWCKTNTELITTTEQLLLKKEEITSNLEKDNLRKRNINFHEKCLLSIMERTRLVEKVKKNHDELLNLQTQLELLKLKTYPTLRFKDVSYNQNLCYIKKNF